MNDKILDLEDIAHRMKCGVDALFMIEEALERGDYCAEDYAGSVYCIYGYLSILVKELSKTVDAIEADRKGASV